MTEDDKALVERMRKYDWRGSVRHKTAHEAADRIKALTIANTGLHDEIEDLREKLSAAYIALSGTSIHASDCATSSAPAYEPGPCDCKEKPQ